MNSSREGNQSLPSYDAAGLTAALVRPGGLWREVRVVDTAGSTNTDLLAEARAGGTEGLVLVAERQTAGRGRMGRQWVSAPGESLTFSVLLRPQGVSAGQLGWVPLLAGVAAASALHTLGFPHARLKWPNDVLAGEAKLAGILAESWGGAVVAGLGINVSQRREELPVPGATSLSLEAPASGASVPQRERLLTAVLEELARWYLAWRDQPSPGDADACGLRGEYLRWCTTVGRDVTVSLPGGTTLTGRASGVDESGRLAVAGPDGTTAVSAGDVVHVDPA